MKGLLKPENQDRLVTLTGRSPQGSGLHAETHGGLDHHEAMAPMDRSVVFSAVFDGGDKGGWGCMKKLCMCEEKKDGIMRLTIAFLDL